MFQRFFCPCLYIIPLVCGVSSNGGQYGAGPFLAGKELRIFQAKKGPVTIDDSPGKLE